MTPGDDIRSSSRQTVFIVDDDPAVCEALSDLMESAGLPTRRFSSAEAFLDVCSPELAGCLLLDVRLPGMTGMELQSRLAESGTPIPIIIMTAHGDIPMVRKALKAGAIEFLTKPFQDSELLQAIDQAFVFDRTQRATAGLQQSLLARFNTLSFRERQVLECVTAGMLNKQIASRLDLSVVTVKLYRRQVMEKMRAESLAELVKMREKIGPQKSTAK